MNVKLRNDKATTLRTKKEEGKTHQCRSQIAHRTRYNTNRNVCAESGLKPMLQISEQCAASQIIGRSTGITFTNAALSRSEHSNIHMRTVKSAAKGIAVPLVWRQLLRHCRNALSGRYLLQALHQYSFCADYLQVRVIYCQMPT